MRTVDHDVGGLERTAADGPDHPIRRTDEPGCRDGADAQTFSEVVAPAPGPNGSCRPAADSFITERTGAPSEEDMA